MKKFLCIILAVLSLSLLAFAADISVKLNGKELDFEQPPVIIEERTLVPLRAIFEALGATVEWDGTNKIVTSQKGDTTIKMGIGDSYFIKNDSIVPLDVPAQIVGEGYTMVPARAVAESFGIIVDWDDSTKTVILKTPKAEIKDAIINYADAEDPEDFYGMYSSSAEPLHTVADPIMEDNNVYFLDGTVKDRASWTYLWIKTQFIPGCKYLIEYDVMLGDDVHGTVIGVDLEQPEDAHHPEDAEHRRTCWEKDGQIIGEEGKQVDDAGQRKQIFANGSELG